MVSTTKKNMVFFLSMKKERTLNKEQTRLALKVRVLQQHLRFSVPLAIKEKGRHPQKDGKIKFILSKLVSALNKILETQNVEPYTLKEVQTAVNGVLQASRCPVMGWDDSDRDGAYIYINNEDRARIRNYVSGLTPLASENELLGVSDKDDGSLFDDLL